MTITDAQFLATLRGKGGARLTMLAEIKFAYQTGSGPAEGTIYLSDGLYITQPTDTPANQRYRAVINKSPEFARSFDLTKLGGRGTQSVGNLVLNNISGIVDDILDFIIDAREVRFYVGDGGDPAQCRAAWPRSDFRLVNVASVVNVDNGEQALTLSLASKTYLLDETIIGDAIATGPNAGKPKPLILGGVCRNVDIGPYLYDTASLKFYINGSSLLTTGVSSQATNSAAVRDNGAGLGPDVSLFAFDNTTMSANAGTDTLSFPAGHTLAVNDVIKFRGGISLPAGLAANTQYWVISSGLTATDFKPSLTKGGAAVDITGAVISGFWDVDRTRYYIDAAAGTLELSASPAGRVTADIAATGGDITTNDLHGAFLFIIKNFTELTGTEYDASSFTALTALEAAESARYGRAVLDRLNVLTLLDEIAVASRSWYTWGADGVLRVGRLDLANIDSATPIDTITAGDVRSDPVCKNLPLQRGKVLVDYRKNWCVQTDGFAGSVPLEDRSKWSLDFQNRATSTDPAGTTYPDNWWDYHRSAIDSNPIELLCFTGTASAGQTVADSLLALFKPWTRVFTCTVGLDKYALNPGDCVRVTYPRHGLDSGKNFRVASVTTKATEQLVDLVLVTQATPDYTSTTFP